jgi:thymidylate synthase (FAD)
MIEKGKTFPLLDHGYIRVIDWMGTEESIVEAARMSTNKGFISWDPYFECPKCGRTTTDARFLPVMPEDCPEHNMVAKLEGDTGLLEYLWEERHAGPFEMCELLIEVQAPIFVFREWHRHRTQSYNELSARYTQMPNLHYIPERHRFEAVKTGNKQAQGITAQVDLIDYDEVHERLEDEQARVYNNYEQMLGRGVPKEVARIDTPVARYSRMRAKTDLRNWLAFLNLRCRPNAQWEIRQYADTISHGIIEQLWPRVHFLFEEYSLFATEFSRTEMAAIKRLFSDPDLANKLSDLSQELGMTERRLKKFGKKLKAA